MQTEKCAFKNRITMSSQQTYLLLPCHRRRDFWLPQSPQSILSGAHSRICPGESFRHCPPCTTHSPARQSSPCQRDNRESSGKRCQAEGHVGWGLRQHSKAPLPVRVVVPWACASFPCKRRIAVTCQGELLYVPPQLRHERWNCSLWVKPWNPHSTDTCRNTQNRLNRPSGPKVLLDSGLTSPKCMVI